MCMRTLFMIGKVQALVEVELMHSSELLFLFICIDIFIHPCFSRSGVDAFISKSNSSFDYLRNPLHGSEGCSCLSFLLLRIVITFKISYVRIQVN